MIVGEAVDHNVIDFVEQYTYTKEEIDPRFSKPMGKELAMSIFFNSDHAHDKITGRSISGIIVMIGSTPILWKSRRQGAFQTLTYGAEFSAMRTATEEAIAICYMLCSLGIKVSRPSDLSGDNAVISNATTYDATLKKKNVALSYHSVKKSIAAGIIYPQKISGKTNIADLLTKPLNRGTFMWHVSKVLLMNSGKDP